MNPYVERVYKHNLKADHKSHQKVIDGFKMYAHKLEKHYVFKYDNEVTQEDFDKLKPDIVISLGGDRTFLRASSLINNPDTPILGIRTTAHLFQGNFCKLTVTEK